MNHETPHDPATHCRPKTHPKTLPWPPNIPELLQSCYGTDTYPSPPEVDQNETSQKAFNWKMAVAAFGKKYLKRPATPLSDGTQTEPGTMSADSAINADDDSGPSHCVFRGDWFQYAYLRRCHKTPTKTRGLDYDTCGCPFCTNNLWRRDDESCGEVTVHLENADLSWARLENANLCEAHLENANFFKARLENANLCEAHLENANFCEAHLENADLTGARLENADLSWTRLESANFCSARLENADLSWTRLESANFCSARLENADLTGARLENAELRFVNLDHADVHGATGLVFDYNRVDRLLIPGDAPDPWSVLRRTYTGPAFFFHLTLLILFLLPYAGKTLFFTWESKAVERIETLAENRVETIPESISPVKDYFQEQLDRWNQIPKVAAIWPLLGYPSWWATSLTIFLIIYNWLRFQLTTRVSLLRDAEERSKITPAKEEYFSESKLKCIQIFKSLYKILQKKYKMGGWKAIKTLLREMMLQLLRYLLKNIRLKFWNAVKWLGRKLQQLRYLLENICLKFWNAVKWLGRKLRQLRYLLESERLKFWNAVAWLGKMVLWWLWYLLKNVCLKFWNAGRKLLQLWYLLKSTRHRCWDTVGLYRVHLIVSKMMWIGYGIVFWQVAKWLWCVQIPLR